MTVVYVYAIVAGSAELDLRAIGAGLAGEPLRALRAQSLAAIVGDLDAAPELNETTLRAHDQTVRAIHAALDAVLPARFGTCSSSDDALRELLSVRARELSASLDHVRGASQITIRLLLDAPPVAPRFDPTDGPGTRYLRERASTQPQRVEEVRAALAALCVGEIVRHDPSSSRSASLYHLVPRENLEAHRDAIERVAGSMPGALVWSGPWPAYAFVAGLPIASNEPREESPR